VQKKLTANSLSMQDYFKKMHASAQSVSQEYDLPLNYQPLAHSHLNDTDKRIAQ